MKELKDIAVQYAAEKTNVFLSQLIEQSFVDGYRMGYKDREDEIPVDLRDNKTEFVDLGLPSGTLWAKEVLRENDAIQYLPYAKASLLSLPTLEQWHELETNSMISYNSDKEQNIVISVSVIGRNGNFITVPYSGIMKADRIECYFKGAYFWIKENLTERYCNAINICHQQKGDINKTSLFEGYKIPVVLIRNR